MRFFLCLLLSLICLVNVVFAEEAQNIAKEQTTVQEEASSQLQALQQYRHFAKLYAPNFVLIGNNATFKVVTNANAKVKLILDYGATIPKTTLEETANDKGVAVFNTTIIDDKTLVGKSVAIDAYVVCYNSPWQYMKATLQNEHGEEASSNRIYIADKDSAKGVIVSPWQSLNTFIMSTDQSENSNFDPVTGLKYNSNTPVYIKNMRDAQDNVRELPTNFSNTNR